MNQNDRVELKEEIAELRHKTGVLMREIIFLRLDLHKERQEKQRLYKDLKC